MHKVRMRCFYEKVGVQTQLKENWSYPENKYIFKVNNRNTRKKFEMLTIKILERCKVVSLLITLLIFHAFF